MPTIGDLATPHPVQVLPTTPVAEAARFMAELGIGVVVVTNPSTGVVVGMLTDRDITVRVVARGLDPTLTPTGDVCSTDVAVVMAHDDVHTAVLQMRDQTVRRLPVVDADGQLVGIVSIEDLGLSEHVAAADLREIIHTIAATYRQQRLEA